MTTGELRQLVDGGLIEASTGRRFPNIIPATAASIGETSDAGASDIDDRVAPISNNLVLAFVGQHVLALDRSY